MNYVQQWNISSFSKPNKTYKVSLKEDGSYVCSCPHHIFRKAECKHIQVAKGFENEPPPEIAPVEQQEMQPATSGYRCYECEALISRETARANQGRCEKCSGGWKIEAVGRRVTL